MFISQKHEPTLQSRATLMQSSGFKAHPSTATFISFNYAERMTSEQGFCTRWDMALSCGNIRPISPSSSFRSLVNYITHLSPGLSGVNGTAGVVPGEHILGNINQNSSWCHWLRQREEKGKPSSCPLLHVLGSHSYKLLAEWEGEFECHTHCPWLGYSYMNLT